MPYQTLERTKLNKENTINVLVIDSSCPNAKILTDLGLTVQYCTAESLVPNDRREVDLAVVSSISACKAVKKTIGKVPIVFLANNKNLAKPAFKEGCIDFMLLSETKKLLLKLKMYARIANIHHMLKKVEKYAC